MNGFFNLLAAGTRSLSFERQHITLPEFEYEPYKPKIKTRELRELRTPRTPAEIMKEAWDDVGNRMREAMGIVEAEYGQQISQSK
jgi:hypothetical protein